MIQAEHIQVGYDEKIVIEDLSLNIEQGEIVSILGPNGCGKSTLLKTLSRVIKPQSGQVLVEGNPIKNIPTKALACKMAMLSQHNTAPAGITVKELVYYGRIPHKKWYETKNKEDEKLIEWALEHTGLSEYKERQVSSLSGGERQRVWLAMALAQRPQVLFLDEPTTYLDISHQLELMELIRAINQKFNMTIVMVLHDLNQASEYSERLIVMQQGSIKGDGTPKALINEKFLRDIYHIECDIDINPLTHKPRIHPVKTCRTHCAFNLMKIKGEH
ncbi:MAG: ABC transporter ATP-binding protein [Niameybacter sp.]|uniref:ABC transporter ATP-binding protein n=1 Tax=Niameybacter sp. TaxID=2033640 RepID=UPI002FC8A55E